jgi:hypothetical protein
VVRRQQEPRAAYMKAFEHADTSLTYCGTLWLPIYHVGTCWLLQFHCSFPKALSHLKSGQNKIVLRWSFTMRNHRLMQFLCALTLPFEFDMRPLQGPHGHDVTWYEQLSFSDG